MWVECKEILVHHQTLVRVAPRALHILETISERLQQSTQAGDPRPEQASTAILPPLQDVNAEPARQGPIPQSEVPTEPFFDINMSLDRISSSWLDQSLDEIDWLNLPEGFE